jgi:glycosyltransferase involved in cell wall biosynthesis
MDTSDITFVVLTKNEAARIGDCLASVPGGSRMLVCDSQSQDGTAELARAAGADVVDVPWRGFAQTRLDAAVRVRTAWTFMLDADERLSAELSVEIAQLEPPAQTAGYSVVRRNQFCGRWVRGAGWWPDRLVRLFRTGHAQLISRHGGDAALHETWQPEGDVGALNAPLEHDSYPTLADYSAKFARYTDIEAQAGPRSVARLLVASTVMPLRALWLYFARGAIFDGWRGAYIAWFSALYPVAVAAKALARPTTPPKSS